VNRWQAVVLGFIVIMIVSGVAIWAIYDSFSAVRHETNRWAVIEDVNRDRIAVEPIVDHVWSELVELNQNGTRMWIGGVVERYNNKWGFRFKPESVTIAQFTAEALQSTINGISADIDYWLSLGWAYVGAKVVEVHS